MKPASMTFLASARVPAKTLNKPRTCRAEWEEPVRASYAWSQRLSRQNPGSRSASAA